MGATTVVTGKTDSVGSVSFDVASSLPKLTLSAADMAKEVSSEETKSYYSSISANHVDSKEASLATVLTAKVEGGEESTTYACTATLTVSVDGGVTFNANDGGVLYLELDEGVSNGNLTTKEFKLEEIGTTNTSTLTFDITGADTTAKDIVKASLKIDNTQDVEQQKTLAGQTFQIKLATTSFGCDPKEAE